MNKIKLFISVCAAAIPVVILYQSCGITKPRYIEYEKADGATTDVPDGPDVPDGTAADDGATPDALAVFNEQVQPAINKTCSTSNCHGGGSGGLTLIVDGGDANRLALKAFSPDAQVIFGKISSPSHSGGDQSENLSLAALKAWIAAETPAGGTEGTGGTEAAEPECPPASIFLAQMQPAIEKSCGAAGCHGTGSGGLTLDEGDSKATANRLALVGNVTDPVELFNKISQSNGETHQGGDRSSDLPKANIDAWWAGEVACK